MTAAGVHLSAITGDEVEEAGAYGSELRVGEAVGGGQHAVDVVPACASHSFPEGFVVQLAGAVGRKGGKAGHHVPSSLRMVNQ